MHPDGKSQLVFVGMTAGLLGLQVLFLQPSWNLGPYAPKPLPTDPAIINPATVRRSPAERIAAEGEVEEFDCYACHEENKELTLEFGPEHEVILPEEHNDLVMRHGGSNRNNNCFNCHNPKKLNQLQTREGQLLTFAESSLLCANCHGPTFRDWELGIHGRVTGYWDRSRGSIVRKDCTSCHDPHAPAFPAQKPAPPPARVLHPPHSSHRSPTHE